MVDDIIGAVMNITLNLLLIPAMGIIGAAIASASSFSAVAALKSAQIFWMHGLHPFTGNYLKPVAASGVFVSAIYLVVGPVHFVWMLAVLFFIFMAVYGISLIITKSLDEEDAMMFIEMERMTGIEATRAKKILKRFI